MKAQMNYLQRELYDLIQRDPEIFEFLQDGCMDGLWYWDLENPEEEWMNAKFWQTLGYDPATRPHKASAWMDIINKDDLALARKNLEAHFANPEHYYDQIIRYRHANGSTVWIQCRGKVIRNAEGKPVRMLGAHLDVTYSKEKEDLLLKTNVAAKLGVWQYDVVHNRIFWDQVTRYIHELPPDYEPIMETALDYYEEGESRTRVKAAVKRAIEDGEPYDMELRLVTAKGNRKWVRAIGQVDRVNGKTIRLYGVFQDIDEIKKAEQAVRNYAVLKSRSEEMEQFAYIASHDLREPLLTIRGYVDLLQEEYLSKHDEDARSYGQTIVEAVDRMDNLIKGLLDYTRLSKLAPPEDVDLSKTMDAVTKDLQRSIQRSGARIEYSGLPTVKGHAPELKVLFQNLISNSIKFRKPGLPPRIVIRAQHIDNTWLFTVRDNGIGISERDQQSIFQLFKTLHDKDQYEGTGLGLSICKKIVERHHGRIGVNSVPGEYTEIEFTLIAR